MTVLIKIYYYVLSNLKHMTFIESEEISRDEQQIEIVY